MTALSRRHMLAGAGAAAMLSTHARATGDVDATARAALDAAATLPA